MASPCYILGHILPQQIYFSMENSSPASLIRISASYDNQRRLIHPDLILLPGDLPNLGPAGYLDDILMPHTFRQVALTTGVLPFVYALGPQTFSPASLLSSIL